MGNGPLALLSIHMFIYSVRSVVFGIIFGMWIVFMTLIEVSVGVPPLWYISISI